MCGIAAVFKYNGNAKPIDAIWWLKTANRVQQSRGPDGEGIWVSEDSTVGLGHRRLAIIDLSPSGAQPMSTEDGLLRITFNGEIYNYRALRKNLEERGYRFQSGSDTEVLLHLYREHGQNMVKQLRGMYAFALWDEARQGLFLARDPFGIKPLYYADNGGIFMAASQVKALLAAGGVDTSPEPAGHTGFFLWGYVPEPFTLYKGIRALPPGSLLWISREKRNPTPQFFCRLRDEIGDLWQTGLDKDNISIKEVEEQIHNALEDTVRAHMVADVPVGVFLSSGIDSSSVAATAARVSSEPLRTVTLGFDIYKDSAQDETPLAEAMALRIGARHTTRWVERSDFMEDLPRIFEAMDQPTIDAVNTYFVSKVTAESGLKVALSGLGGDEIFGGYPSFSHVPKLVLAARPFGWMGRGFRLVSAPVLRRFTSPKYAGIFEFGGTYGGAYLLRRGLFMPWELPEVLDPEMVKIGLRELDPIANLNEDLQGLNSKYGRVMALEMIWYMRNMLLRDSDWASMAHSLEIRVPLVDMEFLRKVVPLLARCKGMNKRLLAMAAWQDPPQEILARSKTGFSFPTREWLFDEFGIESRGLRGWADVVYREAMKIHR